VQDPTPDPRFASDNAATTHPAVMQALLSANQGAALAYGADVWTQQATAWVRQAVGKRDAEVFFVFGGTGANVLGVRALTSRVDCVLCAEASHLVNAETGSPQAVAGVQLLTAKTHLGKLDPDAVRAAMPGRLGDHRPRPAVLSLANATEVGTVYSPDELRALVSVAHELGLRVHVDGARIFQAAAALGCDIADIIGHVGVDALSFGATKNGGMLAEAIVFLDPELARDVGRHRKQITQLPSKMRYVAAQFTALLEGEVWRDAALTSIRAAKALADGVRDVDGVELAVPVETNAVFAIVDQGLIDRLSKEYAFALWDPARRLVRWMTAHDTTEADVAAFVAAVRRCA
jgi:threonine aldolase